ncbi:hypothetical protein [Nonlabens sp.]|uniref:hypothetical protein n=1 Tax=Nonlabens sp. TaxID=1888209 RepID=UPI001BCB8A41|nr:hypothetical protein [Nonlabens sp.]
MKAILKSSFLIFILYLYLFQPPVIDKYYFIAAEIFLVIYLIILNKIKLNDYKFFKSDLKILGVIVLYAIIRDLLALKEVYSFRFMAWGFQSYILGIIICKYFIQNNLDLLKYLFYTSLTASIITAGLVFFPAFDNWYNSVRINLNELEAYKNFDFRYRSYGISENLTFTYSFVMGLFASYSLIKLRKNSFYIISFIFFLFAVIYNARIGFVPVILTLIYIICNKSYYKSLLKASLLLTAIVFFIRYRYPYVTDIALNNKKWVLEFFYSISDLIFNTNYSRVNTLSTLGGDFIVFPKTLIGLIFGEGESLFGRSDVQSSDVGYILQIYYGGFFLLFLLGILFINQVKRFSSYYSFKDWYFFIFFSSILILNFKGFIFSATPGGRILILIYLYKILEIKLKNSNNVIISRKSF